MDRFGIDSHKAAFHAESVSIIKKYALNDSPDSREAFRKLHPIYVEISPVGACNHRCTFCAVDYIGYKSVFLDTQKICNSLSVMGANGVRSVMYAGEGEPLLHKDIAQIVNHAKVSGIDNAFTTNGVHLSQKFLEQCGESISWIKVSFNAGDRETYSKIHRTQAKDYDRVVENLKRAVEWKKKTNSNLVIGIQSLLLPENAHTMEELVLVSKQIGLDYVVIKPYSQHRFSETEVYKDIDYRPYLEMGQKLSVHNSDSFNVVFRLNTINNWLNQQENRYCKCMATPSMWGYIMADGSVYSCSAYLLDERFKLGNINDDDFSVIWTSERKMSNAAYVANELDIAECRVNCRMDQVNRYLDIVINENLPHFNFI